MCQEERMDPDSELDGRGEWTAVISASSSTPFCLSFCQPHGLVALAQAVPHILILWVWLSQPRCQTAENSLYPRSLMALNHLNQFKRACSWPFPLPCLLSQASFLLLAPLADEPRVPRAPMWNGVPLLSERVSKAAFSLTASPYCHLS